MSAWLATVKAHDANGLWRRALLLADAVAAETARRNHGRISRPSRLATGEETIWKLTRDGGQVLRRLILWHHLNRPLSPDRKSGRRTKAVPVRWRVSPGGIPRPAGPSWGLGRL
jgi:hypothetical protein